jgi:hypothetical protein
MSGLPFSTATPPGQPSKIFIDCLTVDKQNYFPSTPVARIAGYKEPNPKVICLRVDCEGDIPAGAVIGRITTKWYVTFIGLRSNGL